MGLKRQIGGPSPYGVLGVAEDLGQGRDAGCFAASELIRVHVSNGSFLVGAGSRQGLSSRWLPSDR